MRAHAIALALLTLLLPALPANAQTTWFVRTTGSDNAAGRTPEAAFRTLARALTAAQNNDTIVLGAGTFTQHNTVPRRTNLTIRGDPTGALTGDAGVTTLTATANTTLNFGSQGSYTLSDLRVNRPGGTAIFVANSSTTLTLIAVESTSSQRLVHTQGGTIVLRNVDISGFTDAAVFAQNSGVSVTIEGSTIGPAATGSIAHAIHSNNATLTIRSSRIHSAAVGLRTKNDPPVTITNAIFHDHAQDAILAEGGTITVHHATIAHNAANAVRVSSGSLTLHSSIVASSGTGLVHEGGTLTMNRGVLHGNSTATTGSTTLTSVSTSNPSFTSPAARDYTLASGSAAIDQGQVVTGSPTEDVLGVVRAGKGAAPDSGAFERLALNAATLPLVQSFDADPGPAWLSSTRTTVPNIGTISGSFNANATPSQQQVLRVATAAGVEHVLYFDLVLLSWANAPFQVVVDGQILWNWRIEWPEGGLLPFPVAREQHNPDHWIHTDKVYRRVWVRFTPRSAESTIVFRRDPASTDWDGTWGLDNVEVRAWSLPTVPYTTTFAPVPGPEWSVTRSVDNATIGPVAGPFIRPAASAHESMDLTLAVTPNQLHYVVFDLVLWDAWSGNGECGCPVDRFEIWANGTRLSNPTVMSSQNVPWNVTATFPLNPDLAGTNFGRSTHFDDVHRRVWFAVTPNASTLRLTWRGLQQQDAGTHSWSIDNIAVRRATDPNLFNTDPPGGPLVNSMPRFRDISTAANWSFNPSTDASEQPAGIHWADFDNDGRLDALISGTNATRLLRQNGPDSEQRFARLTLAAVNNLYRGAAVLDYDRDGRLDFFGFPGGFTIHRFYRNTSTGPGNIAFTNAGDLGFTGPGNRENAAAADVNGDSRVDIILFDGNGANYAAINTAGSSVTFPASTSTFPQGSANAGNGDYASSADVNNDGYPDFFYHYNSGRLFLSSVSSGGVTYQAASRGITQANIGNSNFKTGSAWGDFNNDGWVDLWVGNRQTGQRGMLWINPGPTGNFINVNDASAAQAAGLTFAGINDTSGHRGAAWGDYNNDGFLDLAIATTAGVRLYRNSGNGSFTLAAEGVAAYGNAMDVCFADFDGDGDLDLAATLAGTTPQRLFENISNLLTPNTHHLSVRLLTRDEAGAMTIADARARVELWNAAGTTLLQRRDVGSARGFAGSEPFIAHFGGIDPTQNYQISVWHSGQRTGPITVRPANAATTVAGVTIPQRLTVELSGARRRLTTWAEVDPLR